MLNKNFKSFEEYSNFYGMDFAGVEHKYFEFKSGGFDLAGQLFVPQQYKATLVFIHGFMGHCGVYGKFFNFMLNSHYAIAAFDFPGHGLSTGEQTAIDDFQQYSKSIEDFLKVIKEQLHGPYHIIAHSMGGAVVMDYLMNHKMNLPIAYAQGSDIMFDKIILAAPLVRCTLWNISKIGYCIYSPFLKNIFRVFRNISSEKEYVDFLKYKDPLQSKIISMKWVAAMFEWEKKADKAGVFEKPILVIQGTKDTTVAWKYNLPFIQKKFKRAEIEFLYDAQHEFFNETKNIRNDVFSMIRDYLR
ncbi:MAG: alpha/beta hydrolase [Phycisphaerales bacterium]